MSYCGTGEPISSARLVQRDGSGAVEIVDVVAEMDGPVARRPRREIGKVKVRHIDDFHVKAFARAYRTVHPRPVVAVAPEDPADQFADIVHPHAAR